MIDTSRKVVLSSTIAITASTPTEKGVGYHAPRPPAFTPPSLRSSLHRLVYIESLHEQGYHLTFLSSNLRNVVIRGERIKRERWCSRPRENTLAPPNTPPGKLEMVPIPMPASRFAGKPRRRKVQGSAICQSRKQARKGRNSSINRFSSSSARSPYPSILSAPRTLLHQMPHHEHIWRYRLQNTRFAELCAGF